MTDVPVIDRETAYTTVGGEPGFDIDWPVGSPDDVVVERTRSAVTVTLVYGDDYLIDNLGSPRGSFVRLLAVPLAGDVYEVSSAPLVPDVEPGSAQVYVLARFRGEWALSTIYAKGDAVTRGGACWLSLGTHASAGATEPGVGVNWATKWAKVAAAGADGVGNLSVINVTAETLEVASDTGDNATLPAATTSEAGLMAAADKTKLAGIEAGAEVNDPTNLSVAAKTSTTFDVASSTGADATLPAATTSEAGLMTAADKTKLAGIEAGAEVNDPTNLSVAAKTSTTFDVASSTGADVTLPAATASEAGLMTAADKVKLTAARERLTANRTYYVSDSAGSDTNDGLTVGAPFKTKGKAYSVIAATLDLSGFTVTIQVADGTYAAGLAINTLWVGGGAIVVQGNASTPGNVIVSPAAYGIVVTVPLPGPLTIKDMRLVCGAAGIHLGAPGVLKFSNIEFGACATYHLETNAPGAKIEASGNYAIIGNALIHWLANAQGLIVVAGRTVTLTGTPAFGTAFAYSTRMSQLQVFANTYSGAATGTRYIVDNNSLIFTNGAGGTALPGDGAGSVSPSSEYA